MRDFLGPRAASLSTPAKMLYSAFAALNLLGLASSAILYDDIVRFDARSTPAELYARLTAHYAATDGRRLVETTHAHLFSMSVLLLVAGHLFLLTSASARAKLALIAVGTFAVFAHLAAPWIVRLGGGRGGSALAYPLTGALLFLALGAMTCIPVWEMWRRGQ